MSPSENDLRSALHRGEGEPLDIGRVLAVGRAERSRRRNRITTVTASVAAVAVAITGGILLGNSHGTTTTADSAASPNSVEKHAAAGAVPGALATGQDATASSRPSQQNDAAMCPASFPQRLLPGGGSPGQFGSDGALFASDVTTIVVCPYGSPQGTSVRPGRLLVLTGADATALRASLESAATKPTGASCDDVRPSAQERLAFVGSDASGRTGRVVTTTLTLPICDTKTTNGTALRYAWSPPDGLRARFTALDLIPDLDDSPVAPRPSPSGKNIGSPVR